MVGVEPGARFQLLPGLLLEGHLAPFFQLVIPTFVIEELTESMENVHVIVSRVIYLFLLLDFIIDILTITQLQLFRRFKKGLIAKLTGSEKLEELDGATEVTVGLLLDVVYLELVDGYVAFVAFLLIHYFVEDFIDLFISWLVYGKLFNHSLLSEILV